VVALLNARKPQTCRIEHQEDGNPNGVYSPERKAVVGREKFAHTSHGGWRDQKKWGPTVTCEVHRDCDQMSDQEMGAVVEEWDSSEHDQGIGGGEVKAVEPGHSDDRRTKCHEEEVERRRILGGVEEREHGERHRGLVTPADGITVNIDRAQHDEGGSKREPQADKEPVTTFGIPEKNCAQAIAEGHDADPGQAG
jgi:hypothetical protein